MRLLHVVAFSKKLRWLAQSKVITLKTQPHAVNACAKRSSQRSVRNVFTRSIAVFSCSALKVYNRRSWNRCRTIVNFINILRAAFALIFFCQKIQSQTVTREKLRKALLYEKGARNMLMKLTPNVNAFNDVLSFTHSPSSVS